MVLYFVIGVLLTLSLTLATFLLWYVNKTRKHIKILADKLELIEADTADIRKHILEDEEITKAYDKVLNHNLSCKK